MQLHVSHQNLLLTEADGGLIWWVQSMVVVHQLGQGATGVKKLSVCGWMMNDMASIHTANSSSVKECISWDFMDFIPQRQFVRREQTWPHNRLHDVRWWILLPASEKMTHHSFINSVCVCGGGGCSLSVQTWTCLYVFKWWAWGQLAQMALRKGLDPTASAKCMQVVSAWTVSVYVPGPGEAAH